MSDDDDNFTPQINYELLVESALRTVVRSSLKIAEENGLPGEAHFYITFLTKYPGVDIPLRLSETHPERMTIILQHQFWDLEVRKEDFTVALSFGGTRETLVVPFMSVIDFNDPSVGFGLQFGTLDDGDDDEDGLSIDEVSSTTVAKTHDGDVTSEHGSKDKGFDREKTADVVSLDTFRKRPTN